MKKRHSYAVVAHIVIIKKKTANAVYFLLIESLICFRRSFFRGSERMYHGEFTHSPALSL